MIAKTVATINTIIPHPDNNLSAVNPYASIYSKSFDIAVIAKNMQIIRNIIPVILRTFWLRKGYKLSLATAVKIPRFIPMIMQSSKKPLRAYSE